MLYILLPGKSVELDTTSTYPWSFQPCHM